MKRFLALIAILLMGCLSLIACGNENQDEAQGSSTTTVAGQDTTVSSDNTAGSSDNTAGSSDNTAGSSGNTTSSSQEKVDCQHQCGEWTVVVSPTCVKKGKQKTTCELCGDTIYADAPALGHTEEIIESVEPTCGSEGLGEGKKCAICKKILAEQEIISKLPHTEEIIKGYDPTCIAEGLSEGKKCTVCGEITVEQTEIKATGHQFVSGFCKVCRAEDPDDISPADQNITIAAEGVSDYVVVYDDKDVRVADFAQKFVAYMKDSHRITLSIVPYSQGTDSQHCIYVGDLPEAGRVRARLNSYNDFDACVLGDDYVMYATNSRLYEYLFELLTTKVLYVIRNGNWSTNASRNLIYHSSEYADKSYVDYVIEKSGGKLTQDVLLKFFEARTFVAKDGTTLAYRIYVPYDYDEAKEYPVLMFMHGAGERGNNNLGNMKHMPLNWFSLENSPFWNSIVIAPQCPDGQQWVDTPWAEGGYRLDNVPESNEMRAAIEILDLVEATFPTDLDRYYVAGLSMGGFATWDMIMRYPERFAAAVPLCGGGDYKQAYKLVKMPIYTIHDKGDYTVPFGGTKEMVVALEMLGSTVIHYEEVSGYGHNVWNYASQKAEIWTWLFEQTKEEK